ncbi:hypothetical protein CAPTEDRAFT_208130 [Capitella teleta]|uniref:Uncharacterized protein n=1 Tax=Capitella teleta TaxID=283909 RepID=R7URJ1_CAPTE|nr:hypothetical protein CAPTEDRAFT_208130 [Capitella teleta]|eukprot:ELU08825.1 hypothetical protein CAPTEDRAFT_208130 [Capitella teleta]
MTQQQKQAKKKMEKEKKDITEAYNRRAKQYRELSLHEPVYVQLDPNHAQWQQATITRAPNEEQPRSYEVQLPSGATYSRNRKFIRPDLKQPEHAPGSEQEATSTEPRRSTRPRCAPDRLNYSRPGGTN